MVRRPLRWLTLGAVLVAGMSLLFASAASATLAPTMTLDQSSGASAGANHALGVAMQFNPSDTVDSPQVINLELPPGLLSSASADGGACLTTPTPTLPALPASDCLVGTGTAAISAGGGVVQQTAALSFYLAPPPNSGDLVGLYTVGTLDGGAPFVLGVAPVTVRPSSDPLGTGLNILLVLSNQAPNAGASIQITSFSAQFNSLRYPATCPSAPEQVQATVLGWGNSTQYPMSPPDTDTTQTVSEPLNVTGCASLPYAPKLSVTAAQDSGDKQVQLTTDISQAVGEAPSSSVALTLPPSALAANPAVLADACADPTSGTCTPIGTATATTPLYPTPLTANAYLTTSGGGIGLELLFPPPIPLTITGTINLATNTTTITNIPDLPLTDLALTLNGGASGAYSATCNPPSGTVTTSMTSANGDQTVTPSAAFTISPCMIPTSTGTGTTPGTTPTTTAPTKTTPPPPPPLKVGKPTLTAAKLSGLKTGKISASFKVTAGSNAPLVRSVSVGLPKGLSFVTKKVKKKTVIKGVSVSGAKVKSLKITKGRLVITLTKPVKSLTVKISRTAAKETASLVKKAKKKNAKKTKVTLSVSVTNASGKSTALSAKLAL